MSLMLDEAAGASDVVRAQLSRNGASIAALGAQIRQFAPRAVVTCGRGSSDHAATYAKYLIETHARVLTGSAAPSVSSLYGATQDLRDCLFIAISQSGRSPDILASVAAAKSSGAKVLALCNTPNSPLVAAADWVIHLHAGAEVSVAATKSFLATLASLAQCVAAWTMDHSLNAALEQLPALMDAAWALDWSDAYPELESVGNLFVVGRGLGLGAAQEVALKFKETCGLHAEAFSSAEVKHGPYTLLCADFPALLCAQRDPTLPGVKALAAELVRRGVPVLLAGASVSGAVELPTFDAPAELAPILLVQSAYKMIAELSIRRGFDPDRPLHLKKITETL